MRYVESKEKEKSVEQLDRLPGEHFIKPYEIVLFVMLVIFVLFSVFPREKLPIEEKPEKLSSDVQLKVEKSKQIKKVSKFSLEYIKNLLKTVDYSKKEIVLKQYINELLAAGYADLAYQVLESYKVYIKNPQDFLFIKYSILNQKYIQTLSRIEKRKIRKQINNVLSLMMSKGYSDIKTLKFVYLKALKFGSYDIAERSMWRLLQIDTKNRYLWLEKLIDLKISTGRYEKLPQLIKEYTSLITKTDNSQKQKQIMEKSIDALLSVQDYSTLEEILNKYSDYFIRDIQMTKMMIKAALMANKPDLAASIAHKFLEGRK